MYLVKTLEQRQVCHYLARHSWHATYSSVCSTDLQRNRNRESDELVCSVSQALNPRGNNADSSHHRCCSGSVSGTQWYLSTTGTTANTCITSSARTNQGSFTPVASERFSLHIRTNSGRSNSVLATLARTDAGQGTCIPCPANALTCSSATNALSCGLDSNNVQTFLDVSVAGAGKCVLTAACPTGTYATTSGGSKQISLIGQLLKTDACLCHSGARCASCTGTGVATCDSQGRATGW